MNIKLPIVVRCDNAALLQFFKGLFNIEESVGVSLWVTAKA
jgi:hypothetical protein